MVARFLCVLFWQFLPFQPFRKKTPDADCCCPLWEAGRRLQRLGEAEDEAEGNGTATSICRVRPWSTGESWKLTLWRSSVHWTWIIYHNVSWYFVVFRSPMWDYHWIQWILKSSLQRWLGQVWLWGCQRTAGAQTKQCRGAALEKSHVLMVEVQFLWNPHHSSSSTRCVHDQWCVSH